MGNAWWGRRLACGLFAALAVAAAPAANAAGPTPRIVGGGDADITDVPWQVGLLYSDESDNFFAQFCGGTIRDATTIITAAHCVDGATPSEIDVLVGTDALDGSGTRIGAAAIVVNQNFNSTTLSNDAALITLASPISPFPSSTAQPLSLVSGPEMTSLVQGSPLTVSGWGALQSGGSFPEDLQSVEVPFLSDANCRAAYGQDADTSSMFCAGVTGKDSCQGDSGGPIMGEFGSPASARLVGIVSWGVGCAAPQCPGVYTRVADTSIQTFLTTGNAPPPTAADSGSGTGVCGSITEPPLPPQQPQPQPRPSFDVTQPTIAVGSKSCKKLRCTIRLRVSDPQPSSGLGRLTASVSQKVGKRTRKRSASAKLVGAEYVITTGRLKKGKATVRLVIADLAGFRVARNVSLKVK